MKFRLKRENSEQLGTFYAIYFNELLLHYEFSRTAANNIIVELDAGKTLYEILSFKIKERVELQYKNVIDTLQYQSEIKDRKIKSLEQKIDTLDQQINVETQSVLNVASNELVTHSYSDTLMYEYALTLTESRELAELISEMRTKGFTYSKELSKYIIDHQLGSKYPNISGILTMEKGGRQWDFNGGFPNSIFTIVRSELGLSTQGTTAKAVGFRSYHDMS